MKRRGWLALGTVVIAASAATFLFQTIFADPISRENFARIKEGMTEADVKELFGRPADDVMFLEVDIPPGDGKRASVTHTFLWKIWKGSRVNIKVVIGKDGVVNVPYCSVEELDTITARVRRWIGLDPPLTPVMSYPPAAAFSTSNP